MFWHAFAAPGTGSYFDVQSIGGPWSGDFLEKSCAQSREVKLCCDELVLTWPVDCCEMLCGSGCLQTATKCVVGGLRPCCEGSCSCVYGSVPQRPFRHGAVWPLQGGWCNPHNLYNNCICQRWRSFKHAQALTWTERNLQQNGMHFGVQVLARRTETSFSACYERVLLCGVGWRR